MQRGKVTICQSISLGFGAVLVLLTLITGAAALKLGTIVENIDRNKLEGLMAQKEIDHLNWVAKVNMVLADDSVTGLDVQTDDHKCSFGTWLYGEGRQETERLVPGTAPIFREIEAAHARLHASAVAIQEALARRDRSAVRSHYLAGTLPALYATQELFHRIRKEARTVILDDQALMATARSASRNLLWLGGFALVLGVGSAFFLTRRSSTVLRGIAKQMGAAAEQVATTSLQTAKGSHQLAEGTSQQAASLEEAAASLEEISAMTSRNADNARAANDLMNEVIAVVEGADQSMHRLTQSMHEISTASENISKVVSTIDEIAFQTNLLALNAAVEAARAGDAGVGFAVVASEVRNLAMRAAEAVQNTSSLVSTTIGSVHKGADLVTHTSKSFAEARERAVQTGKLVSEITSASAEQAQGIDTLKDAVFGLDGVTQQLAAHAEESAEVSDRLSRQAAEMSLTVKQLAAMVTSGNGSLKPRKTVPCWEFKKCGREKGGTKAKELGVCPAYPDKGTRCAHVTGTLCGGKVQGNFAKKLASCKSCEFFQSRHYGV